MFSAAGDRTPDCLTLLRRWGVLLGLLTAVLTGCGGVAPVVKIGLVGPFEGQHRAVGYDVIYSARLAVRESNANGGIGRYRIGLVALDDRGDPELAAQAAASLVIDSGVIAVVGHWLPETTDAGAQVYLAGDLPFVAAGRPPLGQTAPEMLPSAFRNAYAEVTPFEEEAGPYAGAGYDAVGLVLAAMVQAEASQGEISRDSVAEVLPDLVVEGITGTVFQP